MSLHIGRKAVPDRLSGAAGAMSPLIGRKAFPNGLSGALSLFAAALMLGALPVHAAPPSVDIAGAWIREAPPGATVLGAYMTLRNRGDRADRLLRAQSPAAGRIEIHEMAVRDGVMRMRPLPSLVLPPGQTVVLKPRSTHMMLLDIRGSLKAGTQVPMTFVFERAGRVRLVVPVKRAD